MRPGPVLTDVSAAPPCPPHALVAGVGPASRSAGPVGSEAVPVRGAGQGEDRSREGR